MTCSNKLTFIPSNFAFQTFDPTSSRRDSISNLHSGPDCASADNMAPTTESHEPQKSQWEITNDYIESLKAPVRHKSPPCLEPVQLLEPLKDKIYLEGNLCALEQQLSVPQDQLNISKLQDLLKEAKESAQLLRAFITNGIGGDPLYAAPTTQTAVKAIKVFETAELAEMVLLYLDVDDLLAARQVNRTLAASITSSSKLQKEMYLQVDPDAHWSTYFTGQNKWSRGIIRKEPWRSLSHDDTRVKKVYVDVGVPSDLPLDQHFVPRTPPAVASMLICQPPVTEMVAHPYCCTLNRSWLFEEKPDAKYRDGRKWIRSAKGFTAADLIAEAKALSHEHRHCPNARLDQHDANGEVYIEIKFRGSVELRDDDLLVQPFTSEEVRRCLTEFNEPNEPKEAHADLAPDELEELKR